METKVNFAVVGAFVLSLGVALIAGVLVLSSDKSYRKAYMTYRVYMEESVSGLSPDAPVRYRGVQVGRVSRIALAPGDAEKVELELDIERGTPIKEDTVAELRTQGLTGIAHVELKGGSRDSPPLQALAGQASPVIRAGPSFMVRLDATLTTLIASLTRASENLNGLLDAGNRAALKRALGNIEVVSRTLAANAASIDAGVQGAVRTMENTARASASLPGLIDRVERSADAFDRMSTEGARAAASTARAMDAARDAAQETVPDLQGAMMELRELTLSLRRFSDQLERDPAMLVHGRRSGKPGPGE